MPEQNHSGVFLVTVSNTHLSFNPRTAGGLSHLRTAGGGGRMTASQRTRKLRKIAISGKRRWIGRGKFYKKDLDHFFDQVKFEVTGGQKGQIFSKSDYFRRK